MLILIAGATGSIGTNLIASAVCRGHKVRALGRNPSKLSQELRQQIESFATISDYDDRAGLEAACRGVDAIICAYAPHPILFLDAQLCLLRAAERAGIKRFHAASWNLDWENMPLGVIESYDPLITFRRQAQITSPIKPLYVFCGVFARTLFGEPGAGAFSGDSAIWIRNGAERTLNVIGRPDVLTPYSVESDVADFSVALTVSDKAELGGVYSFCSDEFTMSDVATTYEKVRGAKCTVNLAMDEATCEKLIEGARANANGHLYSSWKHFAPLTYGLQMSRGTYNPKPVHIKDFPDVKRTSLQEFITHNEWV